jgi:hypothetical protein
MRGNGSPVHHHHERTCTMSKRHYNAFVAILRQHALHLESFPASIAYDTLVQNFIAYCAQDNPRFDRQRFLSALKKEQ